MSLTNAQKERLAKADAIIQAAKSSSKQPRFDPGADATTVYNLTMRWAKEILEHAPTYSSDSRERSLWMTKFWANEPYLSGVINSVTQIDRNRGWSLVGGRNQVLRFSQVLHNYQVAPGQFGWRSGVGAGALSFYTTDIGALIELGRQFESGPLAGLFHLDPTRCVLTGQADTPLKYYPSKVGRVGVRSVDFPAQDYMEINSMTNVDEAFHGLGYCALSRAMELAVVMTAVWRHEQEMLFARAPKGLLLLRGVTQGQWEDSMQANDADLDAKEREWFGNVAVFASGGDVDIDAKIFMLSNLPEGFDQEMFTNMLMYGYALCFGYDAREFWPVSSGSLGTGNEVTTQHRKSTDKGGREFWFGLQEKIQANLPPTIRFEAEERDAEGELIDANLALAKQKAINAMYETGTNKSGGPGLITQVEARELMAEANLIPREWTEAEENDEATDTTQARKRCLEYLEVQQAIDKFPDEPIIQYRWPTDRVQVLYSRGSDAIQNYYDMSIGRGVMLATTKQKRFDASLNRVVQKIGDYSGTRSDYVTEISNAMVEFMRGYSGTVASRNTTKRAMVEAFSDAFETGFVETSGGDTYEPERDDTDYLQSRIDTEMGYINQLFVSLKEIVSGASIEEPLTDADILAEADTRAAMYARTLDGVYGQGKLRGKRNIMLTLDGPDGKESCKTCQKLKGKAHRAKWWTSHELIPGPGNENYDCNGYNCQHQLMDKDGNIWAGNLE